MAAVEISGLEKRFGGTAAVSNLTLTVPAGSFVTLLGPSGCGKTTTLRLIAGFERPDRGEIRIAGRPMAGVPPWHRNIGVVFQNYALFPFLPAFDNVAFGLRMRKRKAAEIAERVEAALALVGLPGLGQRYPRQLSGGQQQRVALARALAIEPDVLLLDEPLSNLDAKLREDMRFELKRIQRETGVTTVFVTHDQDEALTLSDRIAVMKAGEIRGLGEPRDVWERPQDAFVADFLGVDNLFEATIIGAANADALRVALGGQQPHELVVRGGAGRRGIDGPVVLGIRAFDVELSERPADARENVVSGRIRAKSYRGSFTSYQVTTPLAAAPLLVTTKADLEVDSEIWVRLDAGRLMLLEGGER